MSQRDLYEFVRQRKGATGAEVGVAEGRFSLDLLRAGAGRLFLVDVWGVTPGIPGDAGGQTQEWHDANFRGCFGRVEPHLDRVVFLRGRSTQMAALIPDGSLDFVYLDACHAYEFVRDDLAAWVPKVRKGGMVAGHDYMNPEYGVKRAVDEFARGVTVTPAADPADGGFWFLKER